MFIQVISGKTSDPEAFARQGEKWQQEVRPGAIGFLGVTSGVTDDGRFIVIARFDSAESARANNDRPEQGEWWAETEKVVDRAEFKDSTDIVTMLGGGKNDAGFVQVMCGHTSNPARFKQISRRFEDYLPYSRPEIIGGITAFANDGRFVNTVYFESEKAAREAERHPRPPEIDALFVEFDALMDEYLDLTDPLFDTA